MGRSLLAQGQIVLLSAVALVGCQSAAGRLPYSQDPLLLARKPMEGHADRPEPPPAFAEPRPPPLPPEALASMPPAYRLPFQEAALLASRSPSRVPASDSSAPPPLPPLFAESAGRTQPSRGVEALAVSQARQPALYDHAPDLSWLRGRAEAAGPGQLLVDYAQPGAEAEDYGRVLLEENPRLAQVRPGDFIAVHGEVVSRPSLGATGSPPVYRVQEVWLVRRKD
jgi:hypothetical protein